MRSQQGVRLTPQVKDEMLYIRNKLIALSINAG
jgi:hypothetical protein